MNEVDYVVAAIAMAVCATTIYCMDGRSNANENSYIWTVRKTYFQDNYYSQSDKVFCQAFRMSRTCFSDLSTYMQSIWHQHCVPIGTNVRYSFDMKLAIFLSYLGSKSSMEKIADKYGVSKSTVQRIVDTFSFLLYMERKAHVFFPRNMEELNAVKSGFATICGFPNVVGAVDCTLIKKSRPSDFWGWYCRKGFVAYNMQGIVDSNLFFMDFSVRLGGCNDKTLWSKSPIGMNPRKYIPSGSHMLGDSGYNLREFLLTPYQHDQIMNKHHRAFNTNHSKTRNPVERAFGALKSRFLILKTEMDMNTIGQDGIIIAACVILHNWCLRHESDALMTLDEILTMDNEHFENNPRDIMLDHNTDIEKTNDPDTEISALRLGVKKRNAFVKALAAARRK